MSLYLYLDLYLYRDLDHLQTHRPITDEVVKNKVNICLAFIFEHDLVRSPFDLGRLDHLLTQFADRSTGIIDPPSQ